MSQSGRDEMSKQVQTTCYCNKVQPVCCLAGYTGYSRMGPYQEYTVITLLLGRGSANMKWNKDCRQQGNLNQVDTCTNQMTFLLFSCYFLVLFQEDLIVFG